MKKLVSILLMLALLCGGVVAMAECAHANATYTGKGYQEQLTLVGHGDGTHTRTFKVFWYYACGDCGETISKYIEDGTEHEDCVYKGNGVKCDICKLCNDHEFVDWVCKTCGYECDHADSTKQTYGVWTNDTYTIVDETYHHAVYDYADVYICNDCGAKYAVIVDTGREDDEEHEWILRPEDNLDSCGRCGAKKPCDTHTKGSVVSTTNGTKSYTSTAAGHVASYTRTTVYKCSECNWEFSEAETITETQANHSFSGSTCSVCGYTCSAHSYEDGVCSVCGNTCTHANAAHNGMGTSKLKSFVDHRDGTHTRTFEVWHDYECPTCKHVFEKYIEIGTETEAHEYGKDGTCHVCGAKPACETHTKSSVAKETDGEKTYKFENATQHYAEFERTTLYNCDVCGWQFSETVKMTTELEKHSFEDGVCTLCKHVCEPHLHEDGNMFCTYCGMQAKTDVKERTIEEALAKEIPPALEEKGIDTVEEVVKALTEHVVAEEYSEEQTKVMDIELVVTVTDAEGNSEEVKVTEKNFPDDGLEVTFDPPAGTNVNDYTFLVSHLITTGDEAGTVETVWTTIRDDKIVAKFYSLSPVSISWKAKPQAVATLPQTGDESMLVMWVALLAISCTALLMRKRSRA